MFVGLLSQAPKLEDLYMDALVVCTPVAALLCLLPHPWSSLNLHQDSKDITIQVRFRLRTEQGFGRVVRDHLQHPSRPQFSCACASPPRLYHHRGCGRAQRLLQLRRGPRRRHTIVASALQSSLSAQREHAGVSAERRPGFQGSVARRSPPLKGISGLVWIVYFLANLRGIQRSHCIAGILPVLPICFRVPTRAPIPRGACAHRRCARRRAVTRADGQQFISRDGPIFALRVFGCDV
jgi:hypothetical protein